MTMRVGRRGMTIMEIMVVVTIFMVLSGAVMAVSIVGKKAFVSAESSVYLRQQARQALDAAVQELRQAGGTLSPVTCAGSTCTFQVNLGFNLPAPCPANAACMGAQDANGAAQVNWSVRYRLNGTQMVRDVLDASVPAVVQSSRVLANNISQLTFTYTGGATKTVRIQLQTQEVSGQLAGGTMQANATPLVTAVKLRN